MLIHSLFTNSVYNNKRTCAATVYSIESNLFCANNQLELGIWTRAAVHEDNVMQLNEGNEVNFPHRCYVSIIDEHTNYFIYLFIHKFYLINVFQF